MRFLTASLFLYVSLVAGVIIPQAAVHDHIFVPGTQKPVGKNITLGNDITTYVSIPKGKYAKDTAVVILTDVFGLPHVDNLLLTDHWAEAGFQTYAPDYLLGDALPEDGLVDVDEWLTRHGEDVTTPALLSVLEDLASQGITQIAVSGYCFGGLYATRLAQNNSVIVSTMAHPSLLAVPEDFEIVASESTVPIQIHNAELDTTLTVPLAEQIDVPMVGYKPGYNRRQFDGVGHGFAVTANASDPVAVAAKEGAFQSALAWVQTHLERY